MRWLTALLLAWYVPTVRSIQCYDCVGRDCMAGFCEGDYCTISQFAPRWGNMEWGVPQTVKGCLSGELLRKNIRDHCESPTRYGRDAFSCFCNRKANCNGLQVDRLPVEKVELITCECDGPHCKGSSTCKGEMCTFVVNHATGEEEKGCVNATVPLIERRSMGACMVPPITGAMHHSLAKFADDLTKTESCVCGSDYCNAEKPTTTAKETAKCEVFVEAEVSATKMKSKSRQCEGQFCFKAHIKSELGMLSEYKTIGCMSFTGDDELAEELKPIGCANFTSEKLSVNACFTTKDKRAIARANAKQQPPPKLIYPRGRKPTPEKSSEDEDEDYEEPEPEPEAPPPRKEKPRQKPKQEEPKPEPVDDDDDDDESEEEPPKEEEATTRPQPSAYEGPTQPPIPDDSNTTMIAVFVLIMLCIVVSGVVWKFELHKKLFRSSYDSVAGG